MAIRKDLTQQQAYYISLNGGTKPVMTASGVSVDNPLFKTLTMEYQINELMIEVLNAVEAKYAPQTQIKPTTEGPTTITNSANPDSIKGKTPGNKINILFTMDRKPSCNGGFSILNLK